RDAARGLRVPARREDRVARDAGGLVVDVRHAAGDEILDVCRIEALTLLERIQALREQRLRMDARKRPRVLLALAARRPDRVENPCVAHVGRLLRHGWGAAGRAQLPAESRFPSAG